MHYPNVTYIHLFVVAIVNVLILVLCFTRLINVPTSMIMDSHDRPINESARMVIILMLISSTIATQPIWC